MFYKKDFGLPFFYNLLHGILPKLGANTGGRRYGQEKGEILNTDELAMDVSNVIHKCLVAEGFSE